MKHTSRRIPPLPSRQQFTRQLSQRLTRLLALALHARKQGALLGLGPTALATAALATTLALPAAAQDKNAGDLMSLDLDALANLQVTSVSKKAQKITDAAAAIAVITNDDLRRSGVTSLPDALRLVPGLHVAQIDSSNWAITSRGLNNQFANKLLVMIDGRSVYTPLFSGVYWDVQNVLLDDVDRIEVIRGPGATVWGANAVNGVINVVTKSAKDTLGGLVYGGGGTENEIMAGARYGFKVSENTYARIYGKYDQHDDSVLTTGQRNQDAWLIGQGGFRIDRHTDDGVHCTWQGDGYQDGLGDIGGFNTVGRYERRLSDTSSLSTQLYFDNTQRRDNLSDNTRNTVDWTAQHNLALGERNDLIWGVGYRYTTSHTEAEPGSLITGVDANYSTQLASAFLQDEIKLIPDKLSLTLGSKLEHNDLTGFEVQPGARLAYKLSDNQTVWASVARAVRTPSEVEGHRLLNLPIGFVPPNNIPTLFGNEDLKSEVLWAYEIGYRIQPHKNLSVDIAAFYNVYDEFYDILAGTPPLIPAGFVNILPRQFYNALEGETFGGEISATATPSEGLRLTASYTLLQVQMHPTMAGANDASYELIDPQQQALLRVSYDITKDWSVDAQIRYVDEISSSGIDGYTEGGVRLAWRPAQSVELAVVGQNLFNGSHREYNSGLGGATAEVQRSVHGRLTWRF